MQVDLVIRGGTVFDGSGADGFEGDVALDRGRIVAVGAEAAGLTGREEIDARGQIVTPGFIDIHTHYDGQVSWDNRLAPSSGHGVTTVLMGNCGVGFAPCRPGDRERLVRLMEGIEDLPEVVLTEGVPWAWESFPEYLDFLAARSFDINVATQAPHAALRIFVMGERASEREAATAEDRAEMARLAKAAVAAGAFGFATSRTLNHKSSDGVLVPTLRAAEAELAEIGRALGDLGRGVLQVVSDFDDPAEELGRFRRVVEASGRPMSVTLLLRQNSDKWRPVLDWVDACNADGLSVRAQVAGRPIGGLSGFEHTYHPFAATPTFKGLKALAREARAAELRRPEVRARILAEAEAAAGDGPSRWTEMFILGTPPKYEPEPGSSIAEIAARRGETPFAIAYDAMLEQDGEGVLIGVSANLVNGDLDTAGAVLRHPYTLYGLGDGGAHVGILCDASLPTFMLQYWARERQRGSGRIPLAEVIHGLTHANAQAIGLEERGLLRAGWRADINVIDFDRLTLGSPHVVRDLPAGGARIMQEAQGYTATIVDGVVAYRDGAPTGELRGRLIRSGAQGAS